jgi:hypothetical protein
LVSSPPLPKGIKSTKGRSIAMTLSASRPVAHRYSNSSFPTTSVVSRRGVPRWRLATFSAAGCIVSLRCRHIRTKEIATGAVKPCSGLISTFPSMRGCERKDAQKSVKYNDRQGSGKLGLVNDSEDMSPGFPTEADAECRRRRKWTLDLPGLLRCRDSRLRSCDLGDQLPGQKLRLCPSWCWRWRQQAGTGGVVS